MKSRNRGSWPLPATPSGAARTYPSRTSRPSVRRAREKKPLQTAEALYRTRTDDPFLTMEVLYQLS